MPNDCKNQTGFIIAEVGNGFAFMTRTENNGLKVRQYQSYIKVEMC